MSLIEVLERVERLSSCLFTIPKSADARARARAGAMAAAPEAGGLAVPVAGFSREVSAERRERADSAEGRPAGSAIESAVADAFFFQKTSGPCASMRKQ